MNSEDKPLTEDCEICGKKIQLDRGFGWADVGPPEKATSSVHVECIGLGPIAEDFQDGINKALKTLKDKQNKK